jgi:hypothetical protein
MDNLRWWLLLIAAVMFSMSGCASARDWSTWRQHPTHFAKPSEMTAVFTLTDNRLVGTLSNAEGPVVITLVRQDR